MPQPLQIHVPTPCHENWQNMTPNEKGRHCMSCQKTVIDFTNMSDRQILEHISNASSSVCGRFYSDQLNTDLVVHSNKKRYSWAYIWNIAFASFLLTAKANAQTCQRTMVDTSVVRDRNPLVMGKFAYPRKPKVIGQVVDAITGQPIPNATIRCKSPNLKLSVNGLGNFQIYNLSGSESTILKISAKGYNTFNQVIKSENIYPVKIHLQPNHRKAVQERQEQLSKGSIEIIGGEVVIVGKIMPKTEVSATGIIIRKIVDTVTAPLKKDIKIFPNPVIKGSVINLSLSFKKAGEYKMELMDAEGRVVLIQPLTMNTKEQVAQLGTNSAWSPGIYWLRISGRNTKNVYQGKVLIQ